MRLQDLLDMYCRTNRRLRSATTLNHYRAALAQLTAILSREPTVADLNDDTIIALEKYPESRGRSIYTINERTGRVKALWRYAAKRRIVDQWPTIDRLPTPEPIRAAWSPPQLGLLFQACSSFPGTYNGAPANLWWIAWHSVQWATGERTGAMRELRWDWLTDRGLAVPGPARKTSKAAFYVIPASVRDDLLRIQSPCRPLVFPFPYSHTTFYNHYEKLLQAAGLPMDRKCKPQRMRRSHLTHWAAGGGDASARAMHSNAAVTTKFYLDETFLPAPDPTDYLPSIERANVPSGPARPSKMFGYLGRGSRGGV